jgi:hypothetical protein
MHDRPSRSQRWLIILFLLSLPLLNPWIRGDGVGYYAFARAPLIQHNLDFTEDYRHANPGFRDARLDAAGRPLPFFLTPTGHLDNHFAVGPALLWAPFLVTAHAGVLIARALGSAVPADGFSAPYRLAMALGTALYGCLALLLAFRRARRYTEERWALLATLAVWWGSSLAVYVYFNPSWSHAHSAFVVALFLWYWLRTRPDRSIRQWVVLALLAALMLNVYYPNAMVLVVVLVDALAEYRALLVGTRGSGPRRPAASLAVPGLLLRHALFLLIVFAGMTPTFVTRQIVYGGPFASGYIPLRNWLWSSPAFLEVLFSSNHGLFSWTPLLLLGSLGLVLFAWRRPDPGVPLLAAAVAFYLFIACYPDWAGISSYGNRFFVSLTALFVVGLAFLVDRAATLFASRRAALVCASLVLGCFVVWNIGLMYQWGMHLVPPRGAIDFSAMTRNQFRTVPAELSSRFRAYLFHRKDLMEQIEHRDIQQLRDFYQQ